MLTFSKYIHGLLAVYLLAIGRLHGFLDIPNGAPKSTPSTLPSLAEPPLRIASFNIQVLGQTKYNKLDVRNALVKVCSRRFSHSLQPEILWILHWQEPKNHHQSQRSPNSHALFATDSLELKLAYTAINEYTNTH